MNILIVCSANSGRIMPFITEQGNELEKQGINVEYFPIVGKGLFGYLRNFKALKSKLKERKFDIIHAHFGLSGALAILQCKLPVIITFHNGETLTVKGNIISSIASLFSAHNIYVASHIYDLAYFKNKKKYSVLPCGINLNDLVVIPQNKAKSKMNLPNDKVNILFGGNFGNLRKNYALAKQALELLNLENVNLIELKGFTREEVTNLLCGCDLLLLPTKSEGSPQIIKEAMACNCPIVATDVADIKELTGGIEGCYITDFNPENVASSLRKAISYNKRTNGRDLMIKYDNSIIVKKIIEIYNQVLNNTNNKSV